MELDSVLSKVHKLIQRAEHEDTPPEEAKTAQEMADALMLKYKLDEALLDANRPAEFRTKPDKTEVPLVGDPMLQGYMQLLCDSVAQHCDCKVRHYSSYSDGTWNSKIYGFPSDLRYFKILYMELRLHMVGALRPGIDPNKSVAENAYNLHNAGLNWFDMAKLEGWVEVHSLPGEHKFMYRNSHTGERQKWADCIGKFKSGYKKEVERRGEQPLRIPPTGSKVFRENAANGYTLRINQRLRAIREKRANIGNALALRVNELDELFREENEDLFKSVKTDNKSRRRVKYVSRPFSEAGYQAGVRQANSALLDPAPSNKPTKEIN